MTAPPVERAENARHADRAVNADADTAEIQR